MSSFKDREIWRRNEENHVSKYFDCRLSKIMVQKGIKPSQLARFLNVSHGMVTRWHKGQDIPPSDKQELIALFLGCANRAEIWVFKSKRVYDKIARLNRLSQEKDDLEEEIKAALEI